MSVVIPVLDEEGNVDLLVEELDSGLRSTGLDIEVIFVDDGSRDRTLVCLRALAATRSWIVVLHRDRSMGQSAAMYAGIQAARGRYVATLDADLQNDPEDLWAMLSQLKSEGADMVQGDRSANRKDNIVRRVGSGVGRLFRCVLLGDTVRDAGCSARVLKAEFAKQLPLQYKGMHRFFPAFGQILGAKIVEVPVHHRPRHSGKTKYGLGVFDRGVKGFFDCLAVRWMGDRLRDCKTQIVTPKEPS